MAADLAPHPPRVFISYSHDSPAHEQQVRALADQLRIDGVDAFLDQYEVSPPEGWPRWMDRQLRESDYVLVVCTETYLRRVRGDEEVGRGHGVRWESHLVYQQFYDAGALNSKFIPVLLYGGEPAHIPDPLRGATYYRLDQPWRLDQPCGYEQLYRHLTSQSSVEKPVLGKLSSLPPLKSQPPQVGQPRLKSPGTQLITDGTATRPGALILLVIFLFLVTGLGFFAAAWGLITATDGKMRTRAYQEFLFMLVWLLAAIGLWQLQRWAWALLLFLMLAIVVDRTNEVRKTSDISEFALAAPYVPMLGMLLSQPVRRAVWTRARNRHSAPGLTGKMHSQDLSGISIEAKLAFYQLVVGILALIASVLLTLFPQQIKHWFGLQT